MSISKLSENFLDSPKFFTFWQKPSRRLLLKIISLLVTVTFVFPYLTWAFEGQSYPGGEGAVVFNHQVVKIPDDLGTVQSAYQGSGQLVVHIQDLHCNAEVQNHIAGLIGRLAAEHGLQLVTVEGAALPVNVSQLKSYPHAAVKKSAADYFLQQGKMSGAEAYAATGQAPVALEGIESAKLYAASRSVVLEFLNDESQGFVYDLRELLKEVKPRVYNRALSDLDNARQANREGEIPLLKYAAKLWQAGRQFGANPNAYPTIAMYLSQSAKDAAQVNTDALYDDLDRLEQNVRERLYTSAAQRQLDALERRLDIIERLLNISAKPVELKEYRSNPAAFRVARFTEFLQQNDPDGDLSLDADLHDLDKYLAKVEKFYQLADERSGVFVEKTLGCMQAHHAGLAVMVTGGFHTDGILAELKRRNISYLSVRPRITHEDLVNPYYSLLRNRKTTLEKLVAENQNILALEPAFPQTQDTQKQLTSEEFARQPEGVRTFSKLLDLVLKSVQLGEVAEKTGKLAELKAAYAEAVKTAGLDNRVEPLWDQVRTSDKAKTLIVPFSLGGVRNVSLVIRPQGQGLVLEKALAKLNLDQRMEVTLLENSQLAEVEKTVLSTTQVGGLPAGLAVWLASPAAVFLAGGAALVAPGGMRVWSAGLWGSVKPYWDALTGQSGRLKQTVKNLSATKSGVSNATVQPDRALEAEAESLNAALAEFLRDDAGKAFGTQHQKLIALLEPWIARIEHADENELQFLEKVFQELPARHIPRSAAMLELASAVLDLRKHPGLPGVTSTIRHLRLLDTMLRGQFLTRYQRDMINAAEKEMQATGNTRLVTEVMAVLKAVTAQILMQGDAALPPQTRRQIFSQVSENEAAEVTLSLRKDMQGVELLRGGDGKALLYRYDHEAASTQPYFAIGVDPGGIPTRLVIKDMTRKNTQDHVRHKLGNDLMGALNFPIVWATEGERYVYIREIKGTDMIDFVATLANNNETVLRNFFYALGIAASEAYALGMEDRPQNLILRPERLALFTPPELLSVSQKAIMNIDRENALTPRYLKTAPAADTVETTEIIMKLADFCLPQDVAIYWKYLDHYLVGFQDGYQQAQAFYRANQGAVSEKINRLAGAENGGLVLKRLELSEAEQGQLLGSMRNILEKFLKHSAQASRVLLPEREPVMARNISGLQPLHLPGAMAAVVMAMVLSLATLTVPALNIAVDAFFAWSLVKAGWVIGQLAKTHGWSLFTNWREPVGAYNPQLGAMVNPADPAEIISEAPPFVRAHDQYAHRWAQTVVDWILQHTNGKSLAGYAQVAQAAREAGVRAPRGYIIWNGLVSEVLAHGLDIVAAPLVMINQASKIPLWKSDDVTRLLNLLLTVFVGLQFFSLNTLRLLDHPYWMFFLLILGIVSFIFSVANGIVFVYLQTINKFVFKNSTNSKVEVLLNLIISGVLSYLVLFFQNFFEYFSYRAELLMLIGLVLSLVTSGYLLINLIWPKRFQNALPRLRQPWLIYLTLMLGIGSGLVLDRNIRYPSAENLAGVWTEIGGKISSDGTSIKSLQDWRNQIEKFDKHMNISAFPEIPEGLSTPANLEGTLYQLSGEGAPFLQDFSDPALESVAAGIDSTEINKFVNQNQEVLALIHTKAAAYNIPEEILIAGFIRNSLIEQNQLDAEKVPFGIFYLYQRKGMIGRYPPWLLKIPIRIGSILWLNDLSTTPPRWNKFVGSIAGGKNSLGVYQLRAAQVRKYQLWKNIGIDASTLNDLEISSMLLDVPKNVEAYAKLQHDAAFEVEQIRAISQEALALKDQKSPAAIRRRTDLINQYESLFNRYRQESKKEAMGIFEGLTPDDVFSIYAALPSWKELGDKNGWRLASLHPLYYLKFYVSSEGYILSEKILKYSKKRTHASLQFTPGALQTQTARQMATESKNGFLQPLSLPGVAAAVAASGALALVALAVPGLNIVAGAFFAWSLVKAGWVIGQLAKTHGWSLFANWREPVGAYNPQLGAMVDPANPEETLSEAPLFVRAHDQYAHRWAQTVVDWILQHTNGKSLAGYAQVAQAARELGKHAPLGYFIGNVLASEVLAHGLDAVAMLVVLANRPAVHEFRQRIYIFYKQKKIFWVMSGFSLLPMLTAVTWQAAGWALLATVAFFFLDFFFIRGQRIYVRTYPSRLQPVYDFMRTFKGTTDWLQQGTVLADVGPGFPLVTTRETHQFAKALNPDNQVVAAETPDQIAAYVVKEKRGEEFALFDRKGKLIDIYGKGGAAIRRNFLSRLYYQRMFSKLKSGQANPFYELRQDPYREYQQEGIRVVASEWSKGVRAGLKLCFNVMFMYPGQEAANIIKMGADLEDGGFLLLGHTIGSEGHNTYFQVYMKVHGKMEPVLAVMYLYKVWNVAPLFGFTLEKSVKMLTNAFSFQHRFLYFDIQSMRDSLLIASPEHLAIQSAGSLRELADSPIMQIVDKEIQTMQPGKVSEEAWVSEYEKYLEEALGTKAQAEEDLLLQRLSLSGTLAAAVASGFLAVVALAVPGINILIGAFFAWSLVKAGWVLVQLAKAYGWGMWSNLNQPVGAYNPVLGAMVNPANPSEVISEAPFFVRAHDQYAHRWAQTLVDWILQHTNGKSLAGYAQVAQAAREAGERAPWGYIIWNGLVSEVLAHGLDLAAAPLAWASTVPLISRTISEARSLYRELLALRKIGFELPRLVLETDRGAFIDRKLPVLVFEAYEGPNTFLKMQEFKDDQNNVVFAPFDFFYAGDSNHGSLKYGVVLRTDPAQNRTRPYIVRFKEPLKIHYLYPAWWNSRAAYPMPVPQTREVSKYLGQKDIITWILKGAGVDVPRSMVLLATPSHDSRFNEIREKNPQDVVYPGTGKNPEMEIEGLLRKMLGEGEAGQIVVKPNDEFGGRGVEFVNPGMIAPAAARIAAALRNGKNVLLNERIKPPAIFLDQQPHEFYFRAFVTPRGDGYTVSDKVAFAAPYGVMPNRADAKTLILEEVTQKLDLGQEEAAALNANLDASALKAVQAVQAALHSNGVLPADENLGDLLGLDIIVRQVNGQWTPCVLEINNFASGGWRDLDAHLKGLNGDPNRIGKVMRNFKEAALKKAKKYFALGPAVQTPFTASASRRSMDNPNLSKFSPRDLLVTLGTWPTRELAIMVASFSVTLAVLQSPAASVLVDEHFPGHVIKAGRLLVQWFRTFGYPYFPFGRAILNRLNAGSQVTEMPEPEVEPGNAGFELVSGQDESTLASTLEFYMRAQGLREEHPALYVLATVFGIPALEAAYFIPGVNRLLHQQLQRWGWLDADNTLSQMRGSWRTLAAGANQFISGSLSQLYLLALSFFRPELYKQLRDLSDFSRTSRQNQAGTVALPWGVTPALLEPLWNLPARSLREENLLNNFRRGMLTAFGVAGVLAVLSLTAALPLTAWLWMVAMPLLSAWVRYSARLFAEAHVDRTARQVAYLQALGLVLAAALFAPAVVYLGALSVLPWLGAGFAWATLGKAVLLGFGLNWGIHALNNALALAGRTAALQQAFPGLARYLRSLEIASAGRKSKPGVLAQIQKQMEEKGKGSVVDWDWIQSQTLSYTVRELSGNVNVVMLPTEFNPEMASQEYRYFLQSKKRLIGYGSILVNAGVARIAGQQFPGEQGTNPMAESRNQQLFLDLIKALQLETGGAITSVELPSAQISHTDAFNYGSVVFYLEHGFRPKSKAWEPFYHAVLEKLAAGKNLSQPELARLARADWVLDNVNKLFAAQPSVAVAKSSEEAATPSLISRIQAQMVENGKGHVVDWEAIQDKPLHVHYLSGGMKMVLVLSELDPEMHFQEYRYFLLSGEKLIGYGSAFLSMGITQILGQQFPGERGADDPAYRGRSRQLFVDRFKALQDETGGAITSLDLPSDQIDSPDALNYGSVVFYMKLGFHPKDPALLPFYRAMMEKLARGRKLTQPELTRLTKADWILDNVNDLIYKPLPQDQGETPASGVTQKNLPLAVGFWISMLRDPLLLNRALAWGLIGLPAEIIALIGISVLLGGAQALFWMAGILAVFSLLHVAAQLAVDRKLGRREGLGVYLSGWLKAALSLTPYFLITLFLQTGRPSQSWLMAFLGIVFHILNDFTQVNRALGHFLEPAVVFEPRDWMLETIQSYAATPESHLWEDFLLRLLKYHEQVERPFEAFRQGSQADPVISKRNLLTSAEALDKEGELKLLVSDIISDSNDGVIQEELKAWEALNLALVSRGFYVYARPQVSTIPIQVRVQPYFYRIENARLVEGATVFQLRGMPGQNVAAFSTVVGKYKKVVMTSLNDIETRVINQILPFLGGAPSQFWPANSQAQALPSLRLALSRHLDAGELASLEELSGLVARRQQLLDAVANTREVKKQHLVVRGDLPLAMNGPMVRGTANRMRELGVGSPEEANRINFQLLDNHERYQAVVDKVTYLLAKAEEDQKLRELFGYDQVGTVWTRLTFSGDFGLNLVDLMNVWLRNKTGPLQDAMPKYLEALAVELRLSYNKGNQDFSSILSAILDLERHDPAQLHRLLEETLNNLNLRRQAEKSARKPRAPLSLGFWFSLLLNPQRLNRAMVWGQQGLPPEIAALIATASLLGGAHPLLWMSGILGVFSLAHTVARWVVDLTLGQRQIFGSYAVGWLTGLLVLSPYFFIAVFVGWHYPVLAFFSALAAAWIHARYDFSQMGTSLVQLLEPLFTPVPRDAFLKSIQSYADTPENRRWEEFLLQLEHFRAWQRGAQVEDESRVGEAFRERHLLFQARGLDEDLERLVSQIASNATAGDPHAEIKSWDALNQLLVSKGYYVYAQARFIQNELRVQPYFYRIENARRVENLTLFQLRNMPGQATTLSPRIAGNNRQVVIIPMEDIEARVINQLLPFLGGFSNPAWQAVVGNSQASAVPLLRLALSKHLDSKEMVLLDQLTALLARRQRLVEALMDVFNQSPRTQKQGKVFVSDMPLSMSQAQMHNLNERLREFEVEPSPELSQINDWVLNHLEQYQTIVDKITHLLADAEESQQVRVIYGYDQVETLWSRLAFSENFGLDLVDLMDLWLQPEFGPLREAMPRYFAALAAQLGLAFTGRPQDFAQVLSALLHLEEKSPLFLARIREEAMTTLNEERQAEKRRRELPGPLSLGFWWSLAQAPQDLQRALSWGKTGLAVEMPALAAIALTVGIWASPLWLLGVLGAVAGVHTFLKWRVDRARGQIDSARVLLLSLALFLAGLSPYLLLAWTASLSLAPAVVGLVALFALGVHYLFDQKFFEQFSPRAGETQQRLGQVREKLFGLVPGAWVRKLWTEPQAAANFRATSATAGMAAAKLEEVDLRQALALEDRQAIFQLSQSIVPSTGDRQTWEGRFTQWQNQPDFHRVWVVRDGQRQIAAYLWVQMKNTEAGLQAELENVAVAEVYSRTGLNLGSRLMQNALERVSLTPGLERVVLQPGNVAAMARIMEKLPAHLRLIQAPSGYYFWLPPASLRPATATEKTVSAEEAVPADYAAARKRAFAALQAALADPKELERVYNRTLQQYAHGRHADKIRPSGVLPRVLQFMHLIQQPAWTADDIIDIVNNYSLYVTTLAQEPEKYEPAKYSVYAEGVLAIGVLVAKLGPEVFRASLNYSNPFWLVILLRDFYHRTFESMPQFLAFYLEVIGKSLGTQARSVVGDLAANWPATDELPVAQVQIAALLQSSMQRQGVALSEAEQVKLEDGLLKLAQVFAQAQRETRAMTQTNLSSPTPGDWGNLKLTGALQGQSLPIKLAEPGMLPGIPVAAVQDHVFNHGESFNTWLEGTQRNVGALAAAGARLIIFPERYLDTDDPAQLERALGQLQTQADAAQANLVMGVRLELGQIRVDGILVIRPATAPVILRGLSALNLSRQEGKVAGFDSKPEVRVRLAGHPAILRALDAGLDVKQNMLAIQANGGSRKLHINLCADARKAENFRGLPTDIDLSINVASMRSSDVGKYIGNIRQGVSTHTPVVVVNTAQVSDRQGGDTALSSRGNVSDLQQLDAKTYTSGVLVFALGKSVSVPAAVAPGTQTSAAPSSVSAGEKPAAGLAAHVLKTFQDYKTTVLETMLFNSLSGSEKERELKQQGLELLLKGNPQLLDRILAGLVRPGGISAGEISRTLSDLMDASEAGKFLQAVQASGLLSPAETLEKADAGLRLRSPLDFAALRQIPITSRDIPDGFQALMQLFDEKFVIGKIDFNSDLELGKIRAFTQGDMTLVNYPLKKEKTDAAEASVFLIAVDRQFVGHGYLKKDIPGQPGVVNFRFSLKPKYEGMGFGQKTLETMLACSLQPGGWFTQPEHIRTFAYSVMPEEKFLTPLFPAFFQLQKILEQAGLPEKENITLLQAFLQHLAGEPGYAREFPAMASYFQTVDRGNFISLFFVQSLGRFPGLRTFLKQNHFNNDLEISVPEMQVLKGTEPGRSIENLGDKNPNAIGFWIALLRGGDLGSALRAGRVSLGLEVASLVALGLFVSPLSLGAGLLAFTALHQVLKQAYAQREGAPLSWRELTVGFLAQAAVFSAYIVLPAFLTAFLPTWPVLVPLAIGLGLAGGVQFIYDYVKFGKISKLVPAVVSEKIEPVLQGKLDRFFSDGQKTAAQLLETRLADFTTLDRAVVHNVFSLPVSPVAGKRAYAVELAERHANENAVMTLVAVAGTRGNIERVFLSEKARVVMVRGQAMVTKEAYETLVELKQETLPAQAARIRSLKTQLLQKYVPNESRLKARVAAGQPAYQVLRQPSQTDLARLLENKPGVAHLLGLPWMSGLKLDASIFILKHLEKEGGEGGWYDASGPSAYGQRPEIFIHEMIHHVFAQLQQTEKRAEAKSATGHAQEITDEEKAALSALDSLRRHFLQNHQDLLQTLAARPEYQPTLQQVFNRSRLETSADPVKRLAVFDPLLNEAFAYLFDALIQGHEVGWGTTITQEDVRFLTDQGWLPADFSQSSSWPTTVKSRSWDNQAYPMFLSQLEQIAGQVRQLKQPGSQKLTILPFSPNALGLWIQLLRGGDLGSALRAGRVSLGLEVAALVALGLFVSPLSLGAGLLAFTALHQVLKQAYARREGAPFSWKELAAGFATQATVFGAYLVLPVLLALLLPALPAVVPLAIGLGIAGWLHAAYDYFEFSKVSADRNAKIGELISLEQVLGTPEPGQSLLDRHPLGRILNARRDIFTTHDLNYIMKHLKFRVGPETSVKFAAQADSLKSFELDAENTGTVVTLPQKFASLLKPQTGVANLFLFLKNQQQASALAEELKPALDAYRADLLQAQAQTEATDADLEAEQGAKLESVSLGALKAKGLPLQQFLKPVGGRKLGVPGAQLGLLLESFRRAIHPEGQSLWDAVRPQFEFLLKDGQVRSSVLLVKALQMTDTAGMADKVLAEIINDLKRDIAVAQKDPDPERLAVEVQYAAELLNRSRLGKLPSQSELLQVLEKPAAGTPADQVFLLGVNVTGKYVADTLLIEAGKKGLDTQNLAALRKVLSGNLDLSGALQQLLAKTALPEGSLFSTVVGEDVSKFVGSVITGRVETKEVKVGSTRITVAKPVLGNVFADSEQAIQNLAVSLKAVTLTWYQGQLPLVLPVHGGFSNEVARYLSPSALLAAHLNAQSALAQAHAKWALDKSSVNNQQIARVGIRMMKYYARQLEKPGADQAGYNAALEALGTLFANSGVFAKREIGRSGSLKVYAPASLSYGGVLAWAWLWGKHSGDFNLNDDLEKTLREQRLRNLKVESAA